MHPFDALEPLREAVRVSPDNVPLRRHLGDTLLRMGQAAEAEQTYREALRRAPRDRGVQLGLAEAFHQQGKNGEALVLVEELLKHADAPATAHLLAARILLATGDAEAAAERYRVALGLEPALADEDLAARLGVTQARQAAEAPGPAEPATGPVVEEAGRLHAPAEDPPPLTDPFSERPGTTFDDVGGMEQVKDEIRMKILLPLAQPELYLAFGKQVGGGILLYGPPGCGKTHLARATAGEAGADFMAIGLNDILDVWIGASERNLHQVFEEARMRKPCVLFFDEVDALGASRSDLRSSTARHVINQFLSELDCIKASNEGVLVLAATNAPWHLDDAFRRSGRFDRMLFVPPPDPAARAEILRILCKGKPVGERLDFEQLAGRSAHFSGADLKAVVDRCVEDCLRESMRTGSIQPLRTRDLLKAVRTVKPSTREWFATARNYALHANQGGTYDEILAYLEGRK